jgi:hypothetical protein
MMDIEKEKEEERKRCREKYHRLNYKEKYIKSRDYNKITYTRYSKKYPEKIRAQKQSKHIKAKNGYEKHHYSYRPEHVLDVIFLTRKDHCRLHRELIYDRNSMMYITKSGYLINSKKKCLTLLKSIISGFKYTC